MSNYLKYLAAAALGAGVAYFYNNKDKPEVKEKIEEVADVIEEYGSGFSSKIKEWLLRI